MANGRKMNVNPRLDEHISCLADDELVLRLKKVITSGLLLLYLIPNVARLVLKLEAGDGAGIGQLQMKRGARGEKANLCTK